MSVEQSPTPIAAPDTDGKSAQAKQRTKSKEDKYAGVPNLKSPQQVPLQDLVKGLTLTDLIGSRVIEGPYLALRAPYDVVQDGVSWGVLTVDLARKEYLKPHADRFCPHCGAMDTLSKWDVSNLDLIHLVQREEGKDKPYLVRVTIPIWRCSKCGVRRLEPIPFRFEKSILTTEACRNFLAEYKVKPPKCSIQKLAHKLFISEHHAYLILKHAALHSQSTESPPQVVESSEQAD